MSKFNKQIENAIKKKFISPLNYGCKHNINILKNNPTILKHKESVNLLSQAYDTLNNSNFLLKSYAFVDANTLLRSALEKIAMAVAINYSEDTVEEFVDLNTTDKTRNYTRVTKVISKLRTHLNDFSYELYGDMNRDEKEELFNELYAKLCNFTHSSLIVSIMFEVKSSNEKEVLKLLFYQYYYFLKLLLFCCLTYFTKDSKYILYNDNISFSQFFLLIKIFDLIKRSAIDLSKYKSLFYYSKYNKSFFENNQYKVDSIKNTVINFSNQLKENKELFLEKLKEFLK